jgi:hypothetical protein
MPSLLRSVLRCLTFGRLTAGRGQSDGLPGAPNVVAYVPGLT